MSERLKTLVRKEVVQVNGEMKGFDLVDPKRALPVEEDSVRPSRESERPIVDLNLGGKMHLRRKPRFLLTESGLNSAVEFLAEPQPGQTTPAQADHSARPFAREFGDPGGDSPRLEINRQGQARHRKVIDRFIAGQDNVTRLGSG